MATIAGLNDQDVAAIASADGRQIMLHLERDNAHSFAIWPVDGGYPRFHRARLPDGFEALHASPDANAVLGSDGRSQLVLTSIVSGREITRFSLPNAKLILRARLSADGTKALVKAHLSEERKPGLHPGTGSVSYLVDIKRGEPILTFSERRVPPKARRFENDDEPDLVTTFAFSADGRYFALGFYHGTVELWSMDRLKLIKRMDRADDQTTSLSFSPDNKLLIGGSRDEGSFIWRTDTGKLLRTIERESVAGYVIGGSAAVSHDGKLLATGPSHRATSSGDEGRERRVQVFELSSGKRRFWLSGHEDNVSALTFTGDGRWIVSGSEDGTIRYWDQRTGRLTATFAATLDGRWVIVTDKGFFAASADAGQLLSVVRGMEAISIDQMWQSLYSPDLVREHIAGDPNGEVKDATASATFPLILDSGPAPSVAIVSPVESSGAISELVTAQARITDHSTGVGRIEWRVNGVTAGIDSKPGGVGPEYTLTRELALDPGENVIEVVAYNAVNLLASLPARTTVKLADTADRARPKLHLLAIGINAYTDKGWRAPGAKSATRFPPLALAVKDSQAFAADLKQAAGGLYEEVRVTFAHDVDATRENLDRIVDRLAQEIHPRDTFILFAAAHGKSEDGRFYLIPQNFQSGPEALERGAIGQDLIQDWLANRIKAKKALILLDTCESGALVAGHLRSRTEVAASEAAVGRLHEATGRPVLTAAASGKPALEGYNDHGVFTWALLDALRNGDANGNGMIELSELVAHVQNAVPKISAELQGIGRAAVAVTTRAASSGGPAMQSARFGSRGEDFVLAGRLQ